MRIESLSFSSVKGFGQLQNVPLQNLTLIYGPNSSGKSSILQCLLLLKQSIVRAYGSEPGVLEFRGATSDLGGFRTFVHQHDTSREMEIGLRLSGTLQNSQFAFFAEDLQLKMRFGLRDEGDSEPHLLEVSIKDEAEVRFRFDPTSSAMRLADASSSATLINKWADLYERDSPRRPQSYPNLTEADRRWLREWARKHDCGLTGWVPSWSPVEFGRGKLGRPFGGSLDSPRNRLLTLFIYWWESWVSSFAYGLYDFLEKVVYVGPLREFPRRFATEASEGVGVGIRGERLVLHLARHPELIEQVNTAFAEMDIQYRLRVERMTSEPLQDALGDVAIALLDDVRTGLVLSPADVGFGLSQVLPVVVQLLGNRRSMILVEQPEIHLHPKIQSRLTDVIIKSVVANRNQVLVETHSEHILLRAQRRIREGTHRRFDHEALGVQFVGSTDGIGVVHDLRIDANGQLIDPWPDGFFDERFDDLFLRL